MKILCVIDSLGSGGAQRQLVVLARGLKLNGHDVEFFVYHGLDYFRPQLEDLNIPIYLIQKKTRFSLGPVLGLRKLIKTKKYKKIIAYLDTPCLYAELATLGLPNLELIVSERSVSPDGKFRISKFFKSIFHLKAKYVIANSMTQTNWLKASFPWLKNRLVTILNGIDLDIFKPNANIKIRNDNLRLIAIGRISKVKNVIGLIEALNIIKNDITNVTIDWVGRDDNNEVYTESIKLLSKYDLDNRWKWHGEIKDISQILCNYDALIMPSIWEGCPNAVCEALASGLPVLGSNVSDIPYLVGDPLRGLIFDPKNPSEIASCILKFININQEDKIKMGIAAREFAVENLSLNKLISEYESLLAS